MDKGNLMMIKIKKSVKPGDALSESGNNYSLILFNDDVNTFEYVVVTLMKDCDHDAEQAWQCALIAHHNGKCEVKKGMKEDLRRRCSIMIKKGLNVEIIKKP
ncbi:MAG: ATP-dependent Clp protease adaptor ClpS [Bacteroidota bacterium]|nr:ATP-dependent Clp protease adaptor ClpS [Bacteroidota bacterium]